MKKSLFRALFSACSFSKAAVSQHLCYTATVEPTLSEYFVADRLKFMSYLCNLVLNLFQDVLGQSSDPDLLLNFLQDIFDPVKAV